MSFEVALLVFIGTVLLQGLFAGYETGFVSANPIRIRYLAEEEGLPRAARLLRCIYRPDAMLAMLLIGNNIVLVVGTTALAEAFNSPLIATLVATPIYLVFSEIMPKSFFRTHPSRLSLALYPTMRVFQVLLTPFTAPTMFFIRRLMRAVGREQHHISPFMSSMEDVRILVDESADHGAIERDEQRMIHSIIDLQHTQANEIMAPRIDIDALPETATRQELLDLFVKSGRTRIPIYRESIDAIIGVVNAYDVLLDATPEDPSIGRFVREALHVPDTIKLDDLFKVMKSAKQHIAIITDEYGGTDGLVTLEDILEEIFGDIQDEHDREESQIRQVAPNAYVIDARMPLEEACEAMDVIIEDEDVETIGGWVMHMTGRIPAQGEIINHGPYRIIVLDAGPNSLSKVRLELRGAETQE